MSKPKSYEVHNPEEPVVESKARRKKRLKVKKALRAAAFAHLAERTVVRQETARRHTAFDDERRKGDRRGQKSRAVRDSLE